MSSYNFRLVQRWDDPGPIFAFRSKDSVNSAQGVDLAPVP